MRDPEGNKREIIAGEGDGRGKWDRKREKERKKEWEVVFWNVAGMGNRDEDFWKKLKDWIVPVLLET